MVVPVSDAPRNRTRRSAEDLLANRLAMGPLASVRTATRRLPALLAAVGLLGLSPAACVPGGDPGPEGGDTAGEATRHVLAEWNPQDWEIFGGALRYADANRLDTLAAGEAVAAMGLHFVGTPYVPQTLELPGPERLVINFRGLDCVTFVENVLALTRFHRSHGAGLLTEDPVAAMLAYEEILGTLRYREGRPDGYASRLHYFSDWLYNARRNGVTTGAPPALALTEDVEPVSFMSTHPEAYRQLSDPAELDRIREVEAELNRRLPRRFVPEGLIAEQAPAIQTGDIIAATSTVEGLDIAHTGIAYWVGGELHLLHAPLVGSTVVLSERTLADRIGQIEGQDGVMVSRPSASWLNGGR